MRQATEADTAAASNTLALAFAGDPVWGLALAREDGATDHLRPFWTLLVRGAVGNGTVWMTPDAGAVATWIPPGGVELPDGLEQQMFDLTTSTLSEDSASAVRNLWERFDAAHPHTEPHAYLSLLATNPEQRGRGIGQQLLAATLELWDAQGIPSYLESTNPGNNHRYERAGYSRVGGFEAPLNSAPITTMWRPAA